LRCSDVSGYFLRKLGNLQAGITGKKEISFQKQNVEHGLHDDRPLSVSLSVGKIPQDPRNGQALPVIGSRWMPANLRVCQNVDFMVIQEFEPPRHRNILAVQRRWN
jgi:hypothetical protein